MAIQGVLSLAALWNARAMPGGFVGMCRRQIHHSLAGSRRLDNHSSYFVGYEWTSNAGNCPTVSEDWVVYSMAQNTLFLLKNGCNQ